MNKEDVLNYNKIQNLLSELSSEFARLCPDPISFEKLLIEDNNALNKLMGMYVSTVQDVVKDVLDDEPIQEITDENGSDDEGEEERFEYIGNVRENSPIRISHKEFLKKLKRYFHPHLRSRKISVTEGTYLEGQHIWAIFAEDIGDANYLINLQEFLFDELLYDGNDAISNGLESNRRIKMLPNDVVLVHNAKDQCIVGGGRVKHIYPFHKPNLNYNYRCIVEWQDIDSFYAPYEFKYENENPMLISSERMISYFLSNFYID